MEKWNYKFSFVSGIMFIMTFLIKELVVNSPDNLSIYIFIFPFLFMVLYSIGLFLGFIKYSLLNDRILLKYSTISTIFFYSYIVIMEFISRTSIISITNPMEIFVPKSLLGISLIIFSLSLFKIKKIYGKYTILQGLSSLLLGITFIVPFLYLFQLPLFLIFYISLTYLVNKKIKDTNDTTYKGRLL